MTIGVWVLGDQLWAEQAALQTCAGQRQQTPVILIESLRHVQERPYHCQKIVLVWSAMRHFAEELRQNQWQVDYVEADGFEAPLKQWVEEKKITELRVMAPNDRPFLYLIQSLQLPCKIDLIPNNHFLWSDTDFALWAKRRKRLLMEDFYREGRVRFQILMVGDQPTGGRWNFDKENRKPPKGKLNTPEPLWFEPDEITQTVIQKVQSSSFQTYGKLDHFFWAVTRQQALEVLDRFIEERLPTFGPYQDAMVTGEETMWHALLSPYLNTGLLQPLEVIERAEQAYHDQNLSLNSVEGFIRQILGWREYMHGLYTYLGDDYPQRNWFNHTQPLPDFYWNAAQTDMNCLHQSLKQVESLGYAHHIQRLMVLSNFALIAGISPQELESWFHSAFIDGYDWVMQTNVIGMGQFADGGILASKPYASSANYVNKMSDYCAGCRYDRSDRTGANACPFNFFYWDFLLRHREKLANQGRINMVLRNLDRMSPEELQAIQQKAAEWHQTQSTVGN
jgi:deoxyribodipyrimidine photolyase-related protein